MESNGSNTASVNHHSDHMEVPHKMSATERNQVIMIVLTSIAIILLLATLIYLVKNVDEIKSDAIIYGMEKEGYNTCSCSLANGRSVIYNRGVINGTSRSLGILGE